MKTATPRDVITIIDRAFEQGDVETIVSMYDPRAVQVRYMEGSDKGESRGLDAIRSLYKALLEPGKFKVEHLRENLVETDGIALFTSRWRVAADGAQPTEYIATIVLRQQPDGSWRDLIDTGPAVLED